MRLLGADKIRTSTDPNDPGYPIFRFFGPSSAWRIYLDGQEIKDVEMADEAKGEVVRAVRDDNGYLVMENDTVKTELLHGDVEVVLDLAKYLKTE